MTADPAAIRSLARALHEQGDDVRAEADRLVALTEAAGWQGRAGEALLGRVREQGAALRRCAARHDDAAAALERHAEAVEERLALLLAAARRAEELLDDARALPDLLPEVLPDGLPDLLPDALRGVVA
ncbi:septal ring factor EnvC (AmiA/AmiB activator) [Nocardioides marinisabuli]|uniref:Septal ring factor EnvC (AmiA/AmiB activator) n=1 Tax=Nocardioides marinisabuli TaxID=419476 RepID=A0A7Y9F0E6_9ACTN|nr:hypothetical protein [Nocardioides marinisabuli]NYD57302.1 septal ring factor EnvC (AmiA/AmiB activator) [Nocardioides marinisabuli]